MKKHIIIILSVLAFSFGLKAQTLNDYLQIAAENNVGLQAKYKSFEAALQKVAQVGSLPDPNLSFGYFISPVETRVGPQRAKLSLTQMFPWFGTLQAQENVASLAAEANYQEFLEAKNKLFHQVAAAYYPLCELQKLALLEEENVGVLESYKSIATVKFQNGKGAMVDVLRVDIMLNDAITNLSILQQKEKPLLAQFNQLLNREEASSVIIVDSLAIQDLPINYRKDSIYSNHPLLSKLDYNIKASEAARALAIKQGLPNVGLGLDYVIVGQRNDINTADNGKDVFMPMLSFSLPVFRAKYNAAEKEAALNQESLVLQKQNVANQLSSLYEMVWFDIQKHMALIRLYRAQILSSEQSLSLLFTAYGNSGKDFEEVLRMQQQILKYQKLETTAMAAYYVAVAELDYITAKKFLK